MTQTPPLSAQTCDVKVQSAVYTNFSVLGIGIIFGVGLSLWVFSWAVDTIVGKVQKLTGWGRIRRVTWILDSKMQLLRQLYEEFVPDGVQARKKYAWDMVEDSVPVLEDKTDIANMPDIVQENGTEGQVKRWPRYAFRNEDGEELVTLPIGTQDYDHDTSQEDDAGGYREDQRI
jgi:hypothetical protein